LLKVFLIALVAILPLGVVAVALILIFGTTQGPTGPRSRSEL